MKQFIIIFLTCILSLPGFCQSTIGIKAGGNLSTVFTNNNASDTKYQTNIKGPVAGYYLGIFQNINLTSRLGFSPELTFSRIGFKSEMPFLKSPHFQSNNTTIQFYYLNLPLMVSYRLKEKLSVLAGPDIGYLLRSSAIAEGTENYSSFESGKKTDIGISLGMNYFVIPALAVEVR